MLMETSITAQEQLNIEEIRRQLLLIIARALQLDAIDVDPTVPFMEMGASSLALVDAFRAIHERFGVRPAIRKVFEEYDCVDRLAGYILELRAAQPAVDLRQAMAERRAQLQQQASREFARLPLTESQIHLWFLARYSEGAMLAHTHRLVLQLDGALDVPALEEALASVVARHDALRTTFDTSLRPSTVAQGAQDRLFEDSGPTLSAGLAADDQRINAGVPIVLDRVDFSGVAPAELQRTIAAWLREDSHRPFQLSESLWRAALLPLQAERHLLVVSVHGLIADRPALQRFVAEIGAVYSARIFGAEPGLDEPVHFREYADLLVEQALQPEHQRSKAYWSEQYADGIPQIDLPSWRYRPPVKMYDGARLVVTLEDALIDGLRQWNGEHNSTPFTTLLAAFQAWLYRMTRQTDLVVGIFSQGTQFLLSSEPLVANTTNPLPLRTRLDPGQSFAGHRQGVQQNLLAAFDHQDYPFAALIRDLNPERDQSRSAVFTVALDWEAEVAAPAFAGLTVSRITPPIQYTPYDLLLTIVEVDGRFQLQCDYSTELFDAATMRRWMASFKTLLAACLEPAATTPIYELALLPAEERRQILVEWNDTAEPYPQDTCFHHLIEAQVQKTPGTVALIFGPDELTYAELERQANQLARALQRLGVGPQTFVGVCLERSTAMMVGLLGILKAGGAYVPLDPSYPAERLAFMLADSQAPLLLTQTSLRNRFPDFAGLVLCLDVLQDELDGEDGTAPGANVTPADPAYLMYTSGSTGQPKGVQILHRSLVNFAADMLRRLSITSREVVLATTSLSFDIAVTELHLPLMAGGKVVVAPRDRAWDGLWLSEQLGESAVTLMQATPSHWQMVLDAGWEGKRDLKILCAGEALNRELADRLLRRGAQVWNLYGPTETSIYSSVSRIEADGRPITIGRPIANTQLYVLDRRRQPVPIGVPGELYIGGAGVSPGYWQQPELTAEKFISNYELGIRNYEGEAAFSLQPSAFSLYRTGDLVRYLPDGAVEFLGRLDHQVKIRGYRIETEEIQAVLDRHPAVTSSVVMAREDKAGLKILVAYFVPAQEPAPDLAELRAYLAEKLPDFMIPAAFVPMDAFPQTPNGKIDRKALPSPDQSRRTDLQRATVAPRNRVEEILCKIWCEVLNLERVGIHDTFFDLGGHSLLLTPLVLKLRHYFHLRVSMRDFFERPTVAELAEMVAEARASQHDSGANGWFVAPTVAQEGPEAKARFDFLRQEAKLDPSIRPPGKPGVPGATTPQRIFMTGATGFVGAYMVHTFLEQTAVTLDCLIRADDEVAGLARIQEQCERLGLWRDSYRERIRPVPGDVSRPNLGMAAGHYNRLAREVDAILHSAAVVNFIYPYQALKQVNVDGVRKIIQFAFTGEIKPVHYLSTTAIWPMGAHRSFGEDADLDHDLLLNLPYDETKWVAEKMLQHAAGRGLPVAIYRPGEVAGDSRTGFADLSHLASALVKGSLQAGILPALDSFLDATPVDYVAQAIVFLMTQSQPLGRAFHLSNPNPLHARDAYDWLLERGYVFDVIPFDEWRLRILTDDRFADNALYPFAAILEEFTERSLQLPVWETQQTVEAFAGSDVRCPPMDDALLATYIDYYVSSGYLPSPEVQAAALGQPVGNGKT